MREYLTLAIITALAACSQSNAIDQDLIDVGRIADTHLAVEVIGGDTGSDLPPTADSPDLKLDIFVGEPIPLVAAGES